MITMRRRSRPSSFTLIEMLAVIAVIAILAALILGAAGGLFSQGARSRAQGEIKGLGEALETYKVDNGAYPTTNNSFTGPPYPLDPSVQNGNYQISAQLLYSSLSGQTNYSDTPVGNRVYYPFHGNQVGNTNNGTYVQDPFGFAYGYFAGTGSTTDTNNPPISGSGLYDLWSTAGTTQSTPSNQSPTNSWIVNWK
jgi:prepilin-type N-terminal cleavage/methylation domain-containing protein